MQDVFIQVELIVEDVLYGFYVSSQSFCVLHQLCTKLFHMLINHCFYFVCVSVFIITVSFVYCHYVSLLSSSLYIFIYYK